MYFIIALFTIAAAGALISARTLVGYNTISLWWKSALFIALFAAWMAPAILNVIRRQGWLEGSWYSAASYVGYSLFGFAFLLFITLLFRDILWFAGYGAAKLFRVGSIDFSPTNVAVLTKVNIITVVLLAVVSAYALYQGLKMPRVNEEIIYTPKVSREIKILQVNDLHIDRSKSLQWLWRIVEMINREQADVVVMPGDIIDDNIGALAEAVKILGNVKSRYGVWFAAGNHELYNGLPAIERAIREIGYRYLFGNGEKVGDLPLYIAGIPDMPRFHGKGIAYPGLEGEDDGVYKILLAHNPTNADQYIGQGFDLQLSAHTHGGQIFPFHFAVKYVNRYLAGMYEVGKGKLYISRGAGYWGPPMRLLAPADMTVIWLLPPPQ